MNQYIEISQEVADALKNHKPVVALESTIVSHGMPYPDNIEMALRVEEIVRSEGAIPATIALMNGKVKIGLSQDEIKELASNQHVIKVSKRDIGFALSKKMVGATTVSATMIVANLVGIKVFATGGIGGVHRGAETTFDISRDLEELADLDVCVVCAGAKSILDLNLTLEYLETKGVEVIGYQTKVLPAFYTNKSAFEVLYKLDTPDEIAALLKAKWGLGIHGGVLVTNPLSDEDSLDHVEIEAVITRALEEAKAQGIHGKDMTPYLLSKVKTLTQGKSLEANLKLVYSNAKLAALIANAYSQD